MRQIVEIERRFMSIHLLASGSLYHRRDIDNSQQSIPVSDDIVVGPTAQYEWWYQERASLEVDRGLWNTFFVCFEAPAKREMEFCEIFEMQKFSEDYGLEQEKLQELGEMRDLIGTDTLGWVSDEDELERSRAVIQSIKDGLMEYSSTEMEKTSRPR
ncbi:uncharacterized protein N7479_008702 [Penicillium vulpinum]|uniref:uncharacterized protein n=1 Tax=Penicillium vulpinum TaxID=29845 RepID=UPI002547FB2B|nr:uncharacterized protein N7479_008702 [Penicillium vulpinum]KAJ5950289.1 hypothetical protein N7479_008702 [Penicillium vulpinum]